MSEDAPKRITIRYLVDELLLIANLEKGLGYTVKQFLIRPRQATIEYLQLDRKRMMKPFPMLLLFVTIATFLSLRLLPLGESLWESMEEDGAAKLFPPIMQEGLRLITIAMQKYFNIIFMLSLPGQAIGSFILFRKQGYNFAEHLVVNTYLFSVQTLIYTFIIPFLYWNDNMLGLILVLGMYGYWLFALYQIFQPTKWQLIWSSIAIVLIGQAVTNFLIIVALFGYWVYQSIFL